MSNSFILLREKKVAIFITAAAILITVAFHLMLFVLFSPATARYGDNNNSKRSISMLSFDNKNSAIISANIGRWLQYGDPYLMAKPGRKSGYSSTFYKNGFRRTFPDLEIKGKHKTLDFRAGRYSPLEAIGNYNDTIVRESIINIMSLSPTPAKETSHMTRKSKYPLWAEQSGERLPQLFKADEIPSIAALIKEHSPSSASVFGVTPLREGMIPRIRLISGCGVPEMDQFAMKALVSHAIANQGEMEKHGTKIVKVLWKEGN
ncbi:MAG: hypothetical protein A2020_14220 [Lentisphaerae bacterium GWF2_45_14]|nr:MAG: hypothetical protein A2020_14220 [Lentisphaerae bacterium GWF2_45_14]